ncbi:MAG: hypothetical protein CHACPFDD_00689 [Phycisphaerae bacterium]|nr:hypothetical protein [Phycisphaerae bacterium]
MPEISAQIIQVFPFRRGAAGVEWLLLRRRPSSRLGGTWQGVQGKIESGEKAWQAGLRELREETGLTPLRFWQLDSVDAYYVAATDRVMLAVCFAAEVPDGAEVRLCAEHTEVRWRGTSDALREFLWPGQRRALQEIAEHILSGGASEPFLRINLSE